MDQSIVLGASAGLLTVVDCQQRSIRHHTPPWVSEGKGKLQTSFQSLLWQLLRSE
jgi:hypothetical protein